MSLGVGIFVFCHLFHVLFSDLLHTDHHHGNTNDHLQGPEGTGKLLDIAMELGTLTFNP